MPLSSFELREKIRKYVDEKVQEALNGNFDSHSLTLQGIVSKIITDEYYLRQEAEIALHELLETGLVKKRLYNGIEIYVPMKYKDLFGPLYI